VRLCAFDLDHTLVRSPLDLAAMALDMRAHFESSRGPLPSRPDRYRVGELIALCQREAPDLEWRALGAATLEPGALEAVRGVRDAGFQTALWTNNARDITLQALARFGLDALLDVTVTRDDMRQLKPDPAGWRVIAERITMTNETEGPARTAIEMGGLARAPHARVRRAPEDPGRSSISRRPSGDNGAPHVFVVGDSWVDGVAAQAAGVPFIAYRGNPADLERWRVTPIAHLTHLGELPTLLASLPEP
jgi:phosphoglycolate phosphatase